MERDAPSWEEFERIIGELESQNQQAREKLRGQQYVYELLYRGEPDFSFCTKSAYSRPLETSLERFGLNDFGLLEYYQMAEEARLRIETFTDKTWKIPTPEEYSVWLKSNPITLSNYEAYPYLTYLRHHGFPSPLLDWTGSPYIAAFFALKDPAKSAQRVVVYVLWPFVDCPNKDKPTIHALGPNVRSHRRHFLQQSRYTICAAKTNGRWIYTTHQAAAAGENQQVSLHKINIPISARADFLKRLHKMNINSFSLFATEDSLLETLATDIFLLNPKSKG